MKIRTTVRKWAKKNGVELEQNDRELTRMFGDATEEMGYYINTSKRKYFYGDEQCWSIENGEARPSRCFVPLT